MKWCHKLDVLYSKEVLMITLGNDKTLETEKIDILEKNKWIDEDTRSVIIDFNLYFKETYFAVRVVFEVIDGKVVNIFQDSNRLDATGFTVSKIILIILYILPAFIYMLRIIFLISIDYSIITSMLELIHIFSAYAYFAIFIVM